MNIAEQYDIISSNIALVQDRWEICEALNSIYRTIGPCKYIIEIGSYDGGSACLLSNLLTSDGTIIMIDPQLQREIKFEYLDKYMPGRYIHINKYSNNPSTPDDVENILDGDSVGILMIDGGHLPDEVVHDHNVYSKYIRDGAEIHHDLCDSREFGPRDVFYELSITYMHQKFVSQHSINNRTMGIGIIYLGDCG